MLIISVAPRPELNSPLHDEPPTAPLRKRKRSEPDPALAGFIINALWAGNGRSHIVKDHDELIQRLGEDGVSFKVSDVFTVLSQMIEDGRVEP